jgi:hypothetical protein
MATRTRQRQPTPRTVIHRMEEIPAFTTEAEEQDFWSTHELAPELFDSSAADPDLIDVLPPPRPAYRERSEQIALRIPESMLASVRAAAMQRGVGYQTLIKQFIALGLAQETRRRVDQQMAHVGGEPLTVAKAITVAQEMLSVAQGALTDWKGVFTNEISSIGVSESGAQREERTSRKPLKRPGIARPPRRRVRLQPGVIVSPRVSMPDIGAQRVKKRPS